MSTRRPDLVYGCALSGIAICFGTLAADGGYWLLMLWPAASFLCVALGYFSDSARIFGKNADGSRRWWATILLGPYLAFAWLVWNLQVLTSQASASDRVGSRLIIGRRLRPSEVPEDISLVCDLTSELTDSSVVRRNHAYVCHPILDANGLSAEQLLAVVRSLKPISGKRIFIHCANGYGRTGMVAALWLIVNEEASSVAQALEILRTSRPGLRLRKRQQSILDEAASLLMTQKSVQAP